MTNKRSDLADVAQNQARLKDSPSYRISTRDSEFLEGNDGREARLLSEFLKTERTLERERIVSTIIVFGSARIPSPEVAQAKLQKAQKEAEAAPGNPQKAEAVKIAQRDLELSDYYRLAREFAELVARENDKFNEERGPRGEIFVRKQREFVICTGGGPGIMEAANRGAYDAGETSVGLNISLPFEQEPNAFISPSLCFNFHYFSMRKMHFLLRAKALVAFPGGFGTFDELFEALTLRQTGRMQDLPIVLFGEEFWRKCINFEYLAEIGVISPNDLNLFTFVKTAEEAWNVVDSYYRGKEEKTRFSQF